MTEPYPEHPTGDYATALEAMEAAIRRLRALPEWKNWITFCAQGQGATGESVHFAELRLLQGKLNQVVRSTSPKLSLSRALRLTASSPRERSTPSPPLRQKKQPACSTPSSTIISASIRSPTRRTTTQSAPSGSEG